MPGHQDAHPRNPVILHLSADFPDPIEPHKTPVIDRLIDLVEDRYEHRVISLNRRNPRLADAADILVGGLPPIRDSSITTFHRGTALEYLAPPRGLLHATMLERLAAWIVNQLGKQNMVPDLVIGHKLTIEGLLAQNVAKKLAIPYCLTIQGNTDQKILLFRPDLNARFREIYHEAACVFSFAPWGRRAVERRLGRRDGLTLDLPCPIVHDTVRSPVTGRSTVISAFHLRNHRVKNLDGLAAAVRGLAAAGQTCELQIFGGGTAGETAECAAIIADVPSIRLMGPRTQEELGAIMNGAAVFVMPSRRESFGLVFVEALFAGLPIIYPKGASIDGYFDGLPFAIGVNSRNTREIGEAISHAVRHEEALKLALKEWQQAGGLERFSRAAIGGTYATGLDAALLSTQAAKEH